MTKPPANIGDDLTLACGIGTEFGSDVIKTRYSGNMDEFRMRGALQAGTSTVILGREIWQHGDPAEAVAAVSQLVHGACESARSWLPSSNDGARRGTFLS